MFMQRLLLRALVWAVIGDYRSYGLQRPSHKLFQRHPAFGTDLLNYLRQGRINPRPDIERFAGNKVHFNDGTVGEYDMVVAATGFRNGFPFLPTGLVPVENEIVHVYGGAFPDAVKNLYIIGWAQPRNGFGGLLTPAAHLYSEMIALQDEMELPIGYILKWRGFRVPSTNLANPATARRMMLCAHYVLPLLSRRSRILAEKEPREPFDPSLYPFESKAPERAVAVS